MGTQTRRRIPGDVLEAIKDLAQRGWNPAQIAGQLEKKNFKDSPTTRTIRRIVAEENSSDQDERWKLVDAAGDEAALVLPVIARVIEETEGRRSELTRAEAKWLAHIRRPHPDLDLWHAYLLARRYVQAEAKRMPTTELDAFLAFAPWRGQDERERYSVALGQGWLQGPPLMPATASPPGVDPEFNRKWDSRGESVLSGYRPKPSPRPGRR